MAESLVEQIGAGWLAESGGEPGGERRAGQRGEACEFVDGPVAFGGLARNDKAIPPVAERAMAARARAHTVEIASSHAAMVSHPQDVTALVLAAANAR